MLATVELITKHAWTVLYRYSKLRKAKLLRWVSGFSIIYGSSFGIFPLKAGSSEERPSSQLSGL
jgi:hypothetical protein